MRQHAEPNSRNELSVTFNVRWQARAVVTLEGLALSVDPDYGLVIEVASVSSFVSVSSRGQLGPGRCSCEANPLDAEEALACILANACMAVVHS
eukprot:2760716-Pleurochrysis_carterae.AAC.5